MVLGIISGCLIRVSAIHVLYVILKENPEYGGSESLGAYQSWNDFFQGSSGGAYTSIILTENILRRYYKDNRPQMP
jgi:hypothetical protein